MISTRLVFLRKGRGSVDLASVEVVDEEGEEEGDDETRSGREKECWDCGEGVGEAKTIGMNGIGDDASGIGIEGDEGRNGDTKGDGEEGAGDDGMSWSLSDT